MTAARLAATAVMLVVVSAAAAPPHQPSPHTHPRTENPSIRSRLPSPGTSADSGPARQETAGERIRRCPAHALPTALPRTAVRHTASVLAACLSHHPPTSTSPTPLAGATRLSLTARTVTVTGLMCPPTALNDGTCRATSLTVHDLKLRYGPGGMCATAPRLTASGALRLRADHLRGSIFGVLPITFSTRFLPPFPLPYVELTNVTATGLALAADDVHAPHMTFAAADTCNRAID